MANIGGRLEIERTHAIVSNTVISWLEKKKCNSVIFVEVSLSFGMDAQCCFPRQKGSSLTYLDGVGFFLSLDFEILFLHRFYRELL